MHEVLLVCSSLMNIYVVQYIYHPDPTPTQLTLTGLAQVSFSTVMLAQTVMWQGLKGVIYGVE